MVPPGVLCRGEPRGGHACGAGEPSPHTPPLRLQAPGSGSTRQLGQGDRQSLVSAYALHGFLITTQTIRGYMVPLARGCTPKRGWLLPPARLSPMARVGAAPSLGRPRKGTPKAKGKC